jgi:hypothetical protein
VTGPEHYQAAERTLDGLYDEATPDGRAHDMKLLAEAQVHATLALAAPPAPLYGGCAFCDDDGAEDHVRCYCTRDCGKRGCGSGTEYPDTAS